MKTLSGFDAMEDPLYVAENLMTAEDVIEVTETDCTRAGVMALLSIARSLHALTDIAERLATPVPFIQRDV